MPAIFLRRLARVAHRAARGRTRPGSRAVQVMTNGDDRGRVAAEVEARVAAAYGWDTLDKPLVR